MARKETLRTIREWASRAFPDNFARFDTYIKTASFTFSRVHIQLRSRLSTYKVDVLQVGSTHADNEPVFAWKGTEGISVGHKNGEGNIQPHEDFTNPFIDFTAPFCWLSPTENEVGIARFETLVQYLNLSRIRQNSVLRRNIDSFKEHFTGACRDIAEHLASRASQPSVRTHAEISTQARVQTTICEEPTQIPSQKRMGTSARSSQTSQPPRVKRSSMAALPQSPAIPPTPSSAVDTTLKKLDTMYKSFYASWFATLGTSQSASHREKLELQAKIRDLEIELINAEKARNDLETQSTGLNIRIHELEAKALEADEEKKDLVAESAELNTKVSELKAKFTAADRYNEGLKTEVQELKATITDLESAVKATDKAKKETEKTTTELKIKNQELEARLKGTEAYKKDTEKVIDGQRARVQVLSSKLLDTGKAKQDLEAKFAVLNTSSHKLNAKLREADEERKNLRNESVTMKTKLAEASARADEAEQQMATWKARFAAQKKEMLDVCMKDE